MNFHSAFTTECVSFTQSDSLTHPQGLRSQSQVYKIYVSSKSWIRLCASRHHHPPANDSSTTSHKIKLSVSAYPPPLVVNRIFPRQPILLPGSPLPIDPHTRIAKELQPILNSLPTHTSSTVLTPSIFPILQESADSRSPSPIVSARQFHGNKIMNSNQGFSGGSWTS